MVEIGNAIVSLDVFTREFVCDLAACKGVCCEEGDSGAPLDDDELEQMQAVFEQVKPYLRAEGLKAIEQQGLWVVDFEGDNVTPLIDNRECAYTIYDKGIAQCGIERAFLDGKTQWRKPLSCHLYPIRIRRYADFDGVNYDKQRMCAPARACGAKLQVPVYKFLREPLIRKYGQAWYDELEELAPRVPEIRRLFDEG